MTKRCAIEEQLPNKAGNMYEELLGAIEIPRAGVRGQDSGSGFCSLAGALSDGS